MKRDLTKEQFQYQAQKLGFTYQGFMWIAYLRKAAKRELGKVEA